MKDCKNNVFTNESSYQRTFGPMKLRTTKPSEYWTLHRFMGQERG